MPEPGAAALFGLGALAIGTAAGATRPARGRRRPRLRRGVAWPTQPPGRPLARSRGSAVRALAAALPPIAGASPAAALFHLAVVSELLTSYDGDPAVQAVEIEMLTGLQTFPKNSVLAAFDEAGQYVADVLVVPDNVANGGEGMHWLMGTTAFEAASGIQVDFEFTAGLPWPAEWCAGARRTTLSRRPRTRVAGITRTRRTTSTASRTGAYSGPTNGFIGTPTPLNAEGHSLQRVSETHDNATDFACGDPADPRTTRAPQRASPRRCRVPFRRLSRRRRSSAASSGSQRRPPASAARRPTRSASAPTPSRRGRSPGPTPSRHARRPTRAWRRRRRSSPRRRRSTAILPSCPTSRTSLPPRRRWPSRTPRTPSSTCSGGRPRRGPGVARGGRADREVPGGGREAARRPLRGRAEGGGEGAEACARHGGHGRRARECGGSRARVRPEARARGPGRRGLDREALASSSPCPTRRRASRAAAPPRPTRSISASAWPTSACASRV